MRAYVDGVSSQVGEVVFATTETGEMLGLTFQSGRRGDSLGRDLRLAGYSLHEDVAVTAEARERISEYFAGERETLDLLLARRGTDFQEAVWNALKEIPFGETRNYGEIARTIERPGEAVEVGKACATNPVLLVVPCHRVIGADGSLKGYAGGVRIKEKLLEFEQARQTLPSLFGRETG